ncbi:hypothetical protein NQ315_007387 [Exocentrus adspersus]|uniref:Arrestin C-terminal-like domain-containing protein n=1 Tax=Exocentrus adspersus TaxID=1586481 RepID=A0AAV8VI62_9CUCU|nr:hypothetical protein NQ315_007387 [Exocentrus adspersus]
MSCTIQLPNYPNERYIVGGMITGKVICTVSKKINIRGVVVKLKGKEHNRWYDGIATKRRIYASKIKFLHLELPLQVKGTLSPGTFEYPFTFRLPHNIPDSFKGPYGGIRYTITAKVDIPFAPDYTNKKVVRVFDFVNLNSAKYQAHWGPATHSETKTPYSWCCNSGPVTVDVCLEKQMFVPGEEVKMKVRINNQSSMNVDMVIVRITRVTVKSIILSSSVNRYRDRFEVVASGAVAGVKAREEKIYNVHFPIPKTVKVLNFHGSKLFEQETVLNVKAHFIWYTDMEYTTKVVLGHVPITSGSYLQNLASFVAAGRINHIPGTKLTILRCDICAAFKQV